uniref:Uncharacterized protein n=1 Tax=Oryza punctata TaxID=4537 RepID=A0A0E0JQS1_ORYPU
MHPVAIRATSPGRLRLLPPRVDVTAVTAHLPLVTARCLSPRHGNRGPGGNVNPAPTHFL